MSSLMFTDYNYNNYNILTMSLLRNQLVYLIEKQNLLIIVLNVKYIKNRIFINEREGLTRATKKYFTT